ncbi:hypothetical protein HDU98_000373 [Podochytrium sp. JEL0797]|nr:hypothetical protein HDU98_000373 [Podochytrium sp. JEL0797]
MTYVRATLYPVARDNVPVTYVPPPAAATATPVAATAPAAYAVPAAAYTPAPAAAATPALPTRLAYVPEPAASAAYAAPAAAASAPAAYVAPVVNTQYKPNTNLYSGAMSVGAGSFFVAAVGVMAMFV